MNRSLFLGVLLFAAGCSAAAPGAGARISIAPEDSVAPGVLPSPVATPSLADLVAQGSVLAEVLPGIWVQGPEIDCTDGCAQWQAAAQAEVQREIPGYPAISSIRLYRQPLHSIQDPHQLCISSVTLHVVVVSAPGRPDVAIIAYYDAAANIVATPYVPPCGSS